MNLSNSTQQNSINFIDYVGIVASCVCALHCATFPLLLGILPFLSKTIFVSEKFEWFIVISVLLIGSLSFYLGAKRHQRIEPLVLFSIGFSVILFGQLLEESLLSTLLLIIGGGMVAFAHWRNHFYHCQCRVCDYKIDSQNE